MQWETVGARLSHACAVASVRSVRTFMQAGSGGMLALGTISALSKEAVLAYGSGIALALIVAAASALMTFMQNFAEALGDI